MRRAQEGVALIALLAVISLGASWFLLTKLNEASAVSKALIRNKNAEVLNRAKQELIGYVAMNALMSDENDPGALPCPEAAAWFDDPANEGKAAANCSLPKVGRFPWRTIGTDKLVDASGEPLWYVVSSGWAKPNSTTNTVINSNTPGNLTVDSSTGDTIALLIAPGPAFGVAAAPGCAATSQSRPASGSPDVQDYLECENATTPADNVFVTQGPADSFNDQVLRITVADLLPSLEAAIAKRIERDISPALNTVFAPGQWGISGSAPAYPYAAPFANPATSAMQGQAGLTEGLLPLVHAETTPGSGVLCTPSAADPRCNPSFVQWTSASMSGPSTYSESCTTTPTEINCTYYYRCLLLSCSASTVSFTLDAGASNVAMAMREINAAVPMTNVASVSSITSTLDPGNGSANIVLTGLATVSGSGSFLGDALCGLGWPLTILLGCKQSTLSVPIALFADHPLLDSAGSSTGWFVRNRWHELTYYAVAPGHTVAALPSPACTTGTTCLSVDNLEPAGSQRAILLLAGRAINGSPRPSTSLADYLEFGNAAGNYERQPVSMARNSALKKPFNDRIVVVGEN